MREYWKAFLIGCIIGLAGLVAKAQPNVSVVWDYFDSDRVLYNVSTFRVCFDNVTTCVSTPATGGIVMSDTTAGAVSYQTALPGLANGNHTLTVEACSNVSGGTNCSDTVPLNFVVNNKPKSPVKVRVK